MITQRTKVQLIVFVLITLLGVSFVGARYAKLDDGSYRLELKDQKTGVACELRFELGKPVTRHGDDGVVRGPSGEDMFYYFSPKCHVEGTLVVDGRPLPGGRSYFLNAPVAGTK